MTCKSLNLEFTAELYAKIEVAFTLSMVVFKICEQKKKKGEKSQLQICSMLVTDHEVRVYFMGD